MASVTKYRLLMAATLLVGACLAFSVVAQQRDDPRPQFVFEFEATVNGHGLKFDAPIECKPKPGSSTIFRVNPRSVTEELANGEVLYVAVPDTCDHLRHAEAATPKEVPLTVTPLIYIADEQKDPQLVRLFASPAGFKTAGIEVIESRVRLLGDNDRRELTESAGSDPFLPREGSKDHWVAIAYLPVDDAVDLRPDWIAEDADAGECRLIILSDIGRQALRNVDPYSEYLGAFWPQLWRNIPPSNVVPGVNATSEELEKSKRALDLVRSVRLSEGPAKLEPAHKGEITLYRADVFLKLGGRSISKLEVANGGAQTRIYQISSVPPARVQTVLRCEESEGLYIPIRLHFSFS